MSGRSIAGGNAGIMSIRTITEGNVLKKSTGKVHLVKRMSRLRTNCFCSVFGPFKNKIRVVNIEVNKYSSR